MIIPIKIKSVQCSGGACPYQIEGVTEDGQYFYLRYRMGRLRAGVAATEREFWSDKNWEASNQPYNIIDIQFGNNIDGYATHKEFSDLLEGKIIFPDGFKIDSGYCKEIQQRDDRE